MAKVIQEYGMARCVSAEPLNEEKELEWSNWQQDYIGQEGWLSLLVSERKYPGKPFLRFSIFKVRGPDLMEEWGLKTYYNQIHEKSDGTVVFETENSRYTFVCLNASEQGKQPHTHTYTHTDKKKGGVK